MSLKKIHAKNMNVVSLSEAARKISINKGAFHLK